MGAVDELAGMIAAGLEPRRVTRVGTVTAVDTASSPFRVTLDIGFGGTLTATWSDSGVLLEVGEKVHWVSDGASVPVITGRLPKPGQRAYFGSRQLVTSGQVSGASFADGQGDLRTGINGASAAATTAQNTASNAQSTANNAASTAGSAQSTANSAQSGVNSLNGTVNSLQNQINNLNNEVNDLQNQINSLKWRYDNHTTHPPPA